MLLYDIVSHEGSEKITVKYACCNTEIFESQYRSLEQKSEALTDIAMEVAKNFGDSFTNGLSELREEIKSNINIKLKNLSQISI